MCNTRKKREDHDLICRGKSEKQEKQGLLVGCSCVVVVVLVDQETRCKRMKRKEDGVGFVGKILKKEKRRGCKSKEQEEAVLLLSWRCCLAELFVVDQEIKTRRIESSCGAATARGSAYPSAF